MNPYTYVCDLPVQNITSAQEAIERALLALNEEKEIYKITVRELCGRANVARSTFYAYYDVIDDCLQSIENRCMQELVMLNEALQSQESIDKLDLSFFEQTIRYIEENKKLLVLMPAVFCTFSQNVSW